jgi:hypothetical protein
VDKKIIYLGYVLPLLLIYKFNVYTAVIAFGYGACLWVTAYREDDWVMKQHSQHILQIAAKFSVVVAIVKLGVMKTESMLPMPLPDFCSMMDENRDMLWEQYPDDALLYLFAFYLLGAIIIFAICIVAVATWGTLRQLRSIHKEGIRKSLDYRYPVFEEKKPYFEDENR